MKKPADYVLELVADETSSVVALIDTEDDYRIVYANDLLKRFLGRVGISPVGMRWGGRCPFAFGIDAIEVLDEVVKTGNAVRAEERPFGARVSSRFGETTYWNWKCLPAMTEDCPGCVLVMAENVTDRVARRAAEEHQTVQFGGVILDLPIGVATIDPNDFRIIDANDIWLSYLPPEHQTRDSIGRSLVDCMENFELSGIADVLRGVASTREVFSAHEFELIDASRGSTWWSLTVRMMDTDEGVEALLVTAWEVSEQINARQRVERSRERAQAMLQVQQAISASLALDKVLGLITASAVNLMSSEAASVFLLSKDKSSFMPVGAVGIDLTDVGAKALSSKDSLAARALRDGRPVTLSEAGAPEARSLPLLSTGKPAVTIAAAPIVAENEPIGVIEVYSDEHRRFTNDEMESLDTLASTAATAIVNARLYEAVKDTRDQLAVRNRALDNERNLLVAILESLPEAVAVVDMGLRLVRANEAARSLYGAGVGEIVALQDLIDLTHPRTLDGRDISAEDHPLARTLKDGEFRDFEFTIRDQDGNLRYRSVSGSTVKDSDGNIIYGVTVGRDVTEQKMTQARFEELYERERKISQTLQHALMSDVPDEVDGFKMAGVYEAGLREAEIGGDFYEIFSPEDGKLVVVIGDVAGKGLTAAVQIAAAKYGIRSYAYENSSPSYVVSRLNTLLYREQIPSGFVTLFYAVIDVESRTISYSNAGHEPPLLKRKTGEVMPLFSDGIVLGAVSEFDYAEITVSLTCGDKLLLYTDGISEARKQSGDMLGEERLKEFWASLSEDGARESLDAIYNWAKEFSEGHFHDDVAMLVIAVEE